MKKHINDSDRQSLSIDVPDEGCPRCDHPFEVPLRADVNFCCMCRFPLRSDSTKRARRARRKYARRRKHTDPA